jgi:hypothetical protein
MPFEEEEYIDLSISQNKVIEDKDPDNELAEEYDRNLGEEEDEI